MNTNDENSPSKEVLINIKAIHKDDSIIISKNRNGHEVVTTTIQKTYGYKIKCQEDKEFPNVENI